MSFDEHRMTLRFECCDDRFQCDRFLVRLEAGAYLQCRAITTPVAASVAKIQSHAVYKRNQRQKRGTLGSQSFEKRTDLTGLIESF